MSLSDLDSLQVKFSFVGPRKRIMPSIAFTTPSRTLDIGQFAPFERSGFAYDDEDSEAEFTASAEEMKALIDSVGTLPSITPGGVATGGYVSLAMVNSIDGETKGFEAIADRPSGKDLFAKVLEALAGNLPASRLIAVFACATGMMAAEPPTNVSKQVTVRLHSLRFDRTHGTFVGIVRLQNNGAKSLPAPIAVALSLSDGPTILSPDGFTCVTSPRGVPLIRVLSAGSLGSGQTIERTISIENPDEVKIVVRRSIVFAGAGLP
jgi:hypothetical protein